MSEEETVEEYKINPHLNYFHALKVRGGWLVSICQKGELRKDIPVIKPFSDQAVEKMFHDFIGDSIL